MCKGTRLALVRLYLGLLIKINSVFMRHVLSLDCSEGAGPVGSKVKVTILRMEGGVSSKGVGVLMVSHPIERQQLGQKVGLCKWTLNW